jgi:hypothetical protein
MTDYLKEFGTNRPVQKFQMGGPAPSPMGPDPGQAPPQDPAAQGGQPDIEQMIMQVYESQDPQLALQVINMIVEQSGMAGGGGGGVPEQPSPVMARRGAKVPVIPTSIIK